MEDQNYNNNSLAENKILILYILSRINREFIENDLLKIMSSINNINYFYFKDILTDLVNSKLVVTYSKDEQVFFAITDEGRNSLELTIDMLPGLKKLKADSVLDGKIIDIIDEETVSAEYIPENENDYTVKCKIVENNKALFELKVFAGSNEQAKKIADNWKKNASTIYPKIIEMLNK